MMRKKLLPIFFSAMVFAMNPASAQEVTVDGYGIDRDSAIRDASRNAVETVVGTFIDSRTVVSQTVVMLDDIYSKSQGFVRDVKVLEEYPENGAYRVKAKIDVDTNPDAALIDSLTTVMRLNDPRISVIILKEDVDPPQNDALTESILNEKLLDLNFTHVVDADQIIKLYNAELLNSKFNDQRGQTGFNNDHVVDYLVIGKSELDTMNAQIPDGRGGLKNSILQNTRADITLKIYKYETGDIIGTFHVEGSSNENSAKRAEKRALEVAATRAADKLEEKFKKLGANNTQGIQIQVTANDYSKVEQLVRDLQSIAGVESAVIRNFEGGRGLIELDSTQTPRTIVSLLRGISKLTYFVDGITGNTMNLSIS